MTVTAVYDLQKQPTSYDFFTFLTAIATYTSNANEKLEVVFLPAENPTGFQLEKHRASHGISLVNQQKRFENILKPGCAFADATFKIFESRALASDYLEHTKDQITSSHSMARVIAAWKKCGYRYKLHTATTMSPLPIYKEYITITLRNSFRDAFKNTNVAVWEEFAIRVQEEGKHEVIMLPDNESDRLENQDLVKNINDRFWLYENAAMNFGTNNGPMVLCMYSNAPYMLVNFMTEGSASRAHLIAVQITPNAQLPFANVDQRICWDHVETIEDIWEVYQTWRETL